MPTPNIIYIHSHDTGRYIQPYGHAIPTPNLQRLAEEGALFRQAFCAAPTCSPSRAALLTGQSAHNSGMTGLVNRGWQLADYNQHLVNTLKPAGYQTVLAGLQHVAPDPAMIGFDQIRTPQSRHAKDVAPVAVDFLNNAPQQPFFLDVGFFETHRKFPEIGPDDDPRYTRPPAPLPDTPATRRDTAAYITMARELDRGIGQVLDALDANGLADNTLVIATTDHGVAFPGCKCNLTDHGMGIMLILRGPGGFTGGRAIDAMVSHIDIFPTLCDLLAIDPPDWLQGASMLPLLRGETDAIHDAVFAEVSYHAAYEPQRAVRTQRYKYIRRYVAEQTDHTGPVLPNCDDSLSKEVWMKHGWAERTIPDEQLYDLVFDPNETHNLADAPTTQATLAELRDRLDHWMADTDDPLLQGGVAAPSGAQVNPVTESSPNGEVEIVP